MQKESCFQFYTSLKAIFSVNASYKATFSVLNMKAKKPLTGGGSVSRNQWNNNAQPLKQIKQSPQKVFSEHEPRKLFLVCGRDCTDHLPFSNEKHSLVNKTINLNVCITPI